MTNFFYMNAASQDGAGMHLKTGTWGGAGLKMLWDGRKDRGRFPIDIIAPWREGEALAKQREIRMTVIQRTVPTDFIEPDGKHWECPFYVTRRVIEALEKAELKGWYAIASAFEVTNRNGEFLRNEVLFRIVPLGASPECRIENWKEIRSENRPTIYTKHPDQSKDYRIKGPERVLARLIPRMETWDGNDFMFERGGASLGGSFLCIRKVLELAHREQWTNAAFQPLDLLGRNFLDFRLRCWPPEKWYPKWHPSFVASLHQGSEGASVEAERQIAKAEMGENILRGSALRNWRVSKKFWLT